VNDSLSSAPDVVNKDPYGAGWMIKFTVTQPAELDQLMDAAAYGKYCDERKH
jgi:glycine cleavage system H protein